MAILGLSAFKYTSDWEYETSEDTTGSFLASVSFGRLVLRNVVDDERLTLRYRCVSVGLSKGLPFGLSRAHFTDPSGGYGPVAADRRFDAGCFPCRGYILGMGATVGVFQGEGGLGGGVMNMFLFGLRPFAGLRCAGSYRATTPGGGVGAGLAVFELDD